MISPLTVVPLHLGELTAGLSQLDQSLSSTESIGNGVHENLFAGFWDSVLDRVSAGLDCPPSSFCSSEKRAGGVGVWSNAVASRGLDVAPDALIVSWSPP